MGRPCEFQVPEGPARRAFCARSPVHGLCTPVGTGSSYRLQSGRSGWRRSCWLIAKPTDRSWRTAGAYADERGASKIIAKCGVSWAVERPPFPGKLFAQSFDVLLVAQTVDSFPCALLEDLRRGPPAVESAVDWDPTKGLAPTSLVRETLVSTASAKLSRTATSASTVRTVCAEIPPTHHAIPKPMFRYDVILCTCFHTDRDSIVEAS
jgi:hypothetical protein